MHLGMRVSKVKVCLRLTFYGQCRLLSPLRFSIVSMVTVQIMVRIGDAPIFSLLFWWEQKEHIE